eukprot:gene12191-14268_t
MDTIGKTIDNYANVNNPDDVKSSALNSILLDLNSGKLSIQEIVEHAGDYLQNTDSLLRARGTLLLSEILCRLPNLKLNEGQVHFLAEFYLDRLKDYPCASEVVKGVFGLATNHKIIYPTNQLLLRSIFQEVHPSTLPQTHRKMVLQLVDYMLTRNLQELKGDFMAGYIQFIDGEKDPRNIVFSFRLLPKVIESIPEFKNFTDSLFEILSCYFPISFNPKANDPNAITRDDLVTSLLQCFSISPLFAEHAIPFFIDKICSNVIDTKIESLKTMTYCCEKYGPSAVKPFLEDIWSTLRSQILTHKNATVIEESKKTIFYLTRSLARDQSVLEVFLSIINKECLHHIKSSQDTKLSVACASILYQVVCATVLSSKIVLAHVLPHLFDFFQELTLQLSSDPVHKSNEQLSVVALFNDLLKANLISFQSHTDGDDQEPFVERLYNLLISLLANVSILVRTLAVESLSNLYITTSNRGSPSVFLLSEDQRQVIIKSLISFLNDPDDSFRQLFIQVIGHDIGTDSSNIRKTMAPCLSTIHSIIQNTSKQTQFEAISKCIDIFVKGDLSQLDLPDFKDKFAPFDTNNQNQKLLIPILAGIVSQARFDVSTVDANLVEILLRQSLDANVNEGISNACARSLASIVNKQPQQSQYTLAYIQEQIVAHIKTDSSIKLQALNTLVWITKALITNVSPINIQLGEILTKLIGSQDTDISQRAAHSFEVLLDDDKEILNIESGATVKVLYKQRFFTLMFPVLLDSFKQCQQDSNQSISSQYLVAIAALLQNVPKEVLLGELDQVLPIVLHSLKSTQSDLLSSGLLTLLMLTNEASTSIIPHLDTLVAALIVISVNGVTLNLRKSSLEILTLISRVVPYKTSFIYKNQVIAGIIPALDDKKRLVRREASKCRNSWFILQQ